MDKNTNCGSMNLTMMPLDFQIDDKKDEDVVAVLLDEPIPEGQLIGQL